jgi:two-component sensor histidine kinase
MVAVWALLEKSHCTIITSMKTRGFRWVVFAMAAVLLAGGCLVWSGQPNRPVPIARNGVLDLRNWDFAIDGPVALNGEWGFFGRRLLGAPIRRVAPEYRSMPDRWLADEAGGQGGTGAATYVLKVLLPPRYKALALRWSLIMTAFELDTSAAGAQVKVGVPGLNGFSDLPAYGPGFLPLGKMDGTLEVVLRVSNWEYRSGGPWYPIILGPLATIARDKALADYGVWAAVAVFLTLGLSTLIFFLYRTLERANLYFCVMAALMALRVLVTGEYLIYALWPDIPFSLVVRLEYLTAPLLLLAASLFFINFFAKMGRSRVILMSIPLVYTALCLLLPIYELTWSLYIFFALLTVSIGLILGKILIPAWRDGMQGIRWVMAGAMLLMGAALLDIWLNINHLDTITLLPAALVTFLFMQMAALAGRFGMSINNSEQMALELAEANMRLRDEIVQNAEKQREMEELLGEKDLLVREVHHRVKNSLGIVSGILSLQSSRMADPQAVEGLKMLRYRIQALSLVHEKLYAKSDHGSILLGEYVAALLDQLSQGLGVHPGVVQLQVPEEPVELGVDQAVDIGLMVTELITNACKYGLLTEFGVVRVELQQLEEGVLEIIVADDGPGFPADFDGDNSKSLGYTMIRTMLRRSKGTMALLPGPGARVRLLLQVQQYGSLLPG